MKKSSSIAFVYMLSFGLMLAGCNQKPIEIPNLDERMEDYFTSGVAVKDLSGELLQGDAAAYYNSGQILLLASFRDGIPDGEIISYYSNGQISQQYIVSDGILNGPEREYYKNGQLMKSYNYEYGSVKGYFEEFYENGNIFMQGYFLNGCFDGEFKMFDEDGSISNWNMYENCEFVKSLLE